MQEDVDRTPALAAPSSLLFKGEPEDNHHSLSTSVCLISGLVISLYDFTAKFAHVVPHVDEEGKAQRS